METTTERPLTRADLTVVDGGRDATAREWTDEEMIEEVTRLLTEEALSRYVRPEELPAVKAQLAAGPLDETVAARLITTAEYLWDKLTNVLAGNDDLLEEVAKDWPDEKQRAFAANILAVDAEALAVARAIGFLDGRRPATPA